MNGRHHLTVWMITAVLLAGTLAHGSQRPADFGKRWTRSNPFALMGLTIMAQTLIDKKSFDFEQERVVLALVLLEIKGLLIDQRQCHERQAH